MGNLRVYIAEVSLENGQGAWQEIYQRSGNTGTQDWFQTVIDLASYLGKYVRFRFRYYSGTSYTGDCCIDTIEVKATLGGGGGSNVPALLLPTRRPLELAL